MLYDVVELLANYVQYITLTIMIAPGAFPSVYSSPLRFVGTAINAISHAGTTTRCSGYNATRCFEGATVNAPEWTSPDLRRVFALTNIGAPLALIVLFAPVLGPPQFIAFVYSLCIAVFFMVAGALLIHRQLPSDAPEVVNGLSRLLCTVGRRAKVTITATSAVFVVCIAVVGVVLRFVWGRRRRAQVLEQLRQLEQAPHTVEEHVAESLMDFAASCNESAYGYDGENIVPSVSDQGREESHLRYAKAELAYREMMKRRHDETYSFSLRWVLLKVLALLGCTSAVVAFILQRRSSVESSESCFDDPLGCLPVGMLLGVMFLFAVSLLLGFTKKGRRWLFDAKLWFRHLFLYALLLLVSFLYVPLVRSAISVIPCRDVSAANITIKKGTSRCTLGLGATRQREESEGTLQFSASSNMVCTGVERFVRASAVLTSISYALFFVFLYGLVTRQVLLALRHYPLDISRDRLSQRAELDARDNGGGEGGLRSPRCLCEARSLPRGTPPRERATHNNGNHTEHINYYERVRKSQNEVHFLCAPYTFSWRYFKLVVLAQKTVMILFSTVAQEGRELASPWTGFVASIILNLGVFVVLVMCRPYAGSIELAVSLALQLMLSLLAAAGLASCFFPTAISEPFWSFIAFSLFLVPCVALLWGGVSANRRRCRGVNGRPTRARPQGDNVVGTSLLGTLGRVLWPQSECVPPSWLQHHKRSPHYDQVFVPALYFTPLKSSATAVAGIPRGAMAAELPQVDNGELCCAGDAKECGLDWRKASAPLPMFAGSAISDETSNLQDESPSSSITPIKPTTGSENRSKERWAHVRSALFSGKWRSLSPVGKAPCHRQTPTVSSLWRDNEFATPHISKLLSGASVSNSPLAGRRQIYQRSMTALFAKVGSECRWGVPPCDCGGAAASRDRRQGISRCSARHSVLSPSQVRYREAFLRRACAVVARQRLLSFYRDQELHLHRKQRAVDCYINAEAAQAVRRLFIFLGVSTAIAASLFFAGHSPC